MSAEEMGGCTDGHGNLEDVRGRATLLRLPIILFTFPSTSSYAFSAPPPSLRVAIIFPVAMFIFILIIIIFAALLFVTLLALIPPLIIALSSSSPTYMSSRAPSTFASAIPSTRHHAPFVFPRASLSTRSPRYQSSRHAPF